MSTQDVPVIDTSKIGESAAYRLTVATAKAFRLFLEQPGAREYLDAKIAAMHATKSNS